jgi:hypothetical protein
MVARRARPVVPYLEIAGSRARVKTDVRTDDDEGPAIRRFRRRLSVRLASGDCARRKQNRRQGKVSAQHDGVPELPDRPS